MTKLLQGLAVLALVVIGAVLGHLLFPSHLPAPPPLITRIVDTVPDTIRLAPPPAPRAGSPNLVIRETHHDLVTIAAPGPGIRPLVLVVPDTTRPRLYPLLSLLVGRGVGDTTRVTTFGLQRGDGVTSQIYTPGPLKAVWADSSGTPRFDWYPAPAPGCELGCKLKLVGAGVGLGAVGILVARVIFAR